MKGQRKKTISETFDLKSSNPFVFNHQQLFDLHCKKIVSDFFQ